MRIQHPWWTTPLEEFRQAYNMNPCITGLMPKVKIDQEACTACGLCYNDECPDVFEEGDEGKSTLKPGDTSRQEGLR
jgi:ferredoxin